MEKKMRVMTERPLNAETPVERLQTWITANDVFFKRNQGQIMEMPVDLDSWRLSVTGLVNQPIQWRFSDILALPKLEIANTLECSGNSRSLLEKKASGNPWTIGGVGNAVWGGVRLADVLEKSGIDARARHVSFEGLDKPLGKANIKFLRSIPIEKAMASTILAYEMNGEPLPVAHGFPMRALALGWTGASCVKWLSTITLLEMPQEGFFMDKVYRVFQKGENPASGEVVTGISLKSIITSPENGATRAPGTVAVRGRHTPGRLMSPSWRSAWTRAPPGNRRLLWAPMNPTPGGGGEYQWAASAPGQYVIMARATDSSGRTQPASADWNALGYGNNGIREHAVTVHIE
jgi:DMSO/TMAO reductase YedYZ molybdopterin-dependent catalytic subunit